jgi:hypothetical protein
MCGVRRYRKNRIARAISSGWPKRGIAPLATYESYFTLLTLASAISATALPERPRRRAQAFREIVSNCVVFRSERLIPVRRRHDSSRTRNCSKRAHPEIPAHGSETSDEKIALQLGIGK